MNGLRARQGVYMAIDEANAAGGVLGKKIVLKMEDCDKTAEGAINATNKLASSGIVGLVGPHYSAQVMAVSQQMQNYKIPFLIGGTSPKITTTLDNPYLFRIRASDTIQARAAAAYLVEKLGVKKVGIMHNSDDFGVGGATVAEEYFKSKNIPYVAEVHNLEDKDVTGQIMKLKNAGVDGVLVWTLDIPIVVVARQMYELGLKLPTVASPGISNTSVRSTVDSKWLEGWYAVTDFLPTNPDPLIQNFNKRYIERYGEEPDMFSSAYYGAAVLLIDAIKRANSDKPEDITKALTQANLQGLFGIYKANDKREMVSQINILHMKPNLDMEYIDTVVVPR